MFILRHLKDGVSGSKSIIIMKQLVSLISRLASPGTGNKLPGYISSDYIFDSIKHNRLQDLEKYR